MLYQIISICLFFYPSVHLASIIIHFEVNCRHQHFSLNTSAGHHQLEFNFSLRWNLYTVAYTSLTLLLRNTFITQTPNKIENIAITSESSFMFLLIWSPPQASDKHYVLNFFPHHKLVLPYTNGTTQPVYLKASVTQHNVLRFIHVFTFISIHSFLLLRSISLYGWTTV